MENQRASLRRWGGVRGGFGGGDWGGGGDYFAEFRLVVGRGGHFWRVEVVGLELVMLIL